MAWKKETIIKKLGQAVVNCKTSAQAADDALFFKKKDDKWSIAENIDHLTISAKGVIRAQSMPKEQLLASFGKPIHKSREYKTVFEAYTNFLAKRAIPINPFGPRITEGETPQDVLQRFDTQHNSYIDLIKNISETDLDSYQLPHPALGNMTLREMAYFTVFHVEHHTNTIKNIL